MSQSVKEKVERETVNVNGRKSLPCKTEPLTTAAKRTQLRKLAIAKSKSHREDCHPY